MLREDMAGSNPFPPLITDSLHGLPRYFLCEAWPAKKGETSLPPELVPTAVQGDQTPHRQHAKWNPSEEPPQQLRMRNPFGEH